jgi:nicotinate-nucleotide adenylyltransferase
MRIGLFFGSFNPIHIGHMALANYMVEYTEIEQLWFVVSPQNPFKKKASLLDENARYDLIYESIREDARFRVSNIEFQLDRPSYTADTLVHLKEKFPEHQFYLIMGQDNVPTFHKWKNSEFISDNFEVLVYPRNGSPIDEKELPKNFKITEAPDIEVSASFIRNAISQGKDVSWFVPRSAWEIIDQFGYYQ